jgi:hypothetical protein
METNLLWTLFGGNLFEVLAIILTLILVVGGAYLLVRKL